MPAPRKYPAPKIGDRFGHGVVTGYAHFKRHPDRRHWDRGAVLLCDCGREYLAAIDSLYRAKAAVKSCGCQRKKRGIIATPGYARHPLYFTWHNMVSRCLNPDFPGYEYWGGRGIRICDEWTGPDGLKNFIEYVEVFLGPRPSAQHSIDRTDNDGDYGPGKIRWATKLEQVRNSRPKRGRRKRGADGKLLPDPRFS